MFAIFQVLENKGSKVVGIDVSEYKRRNRMALLDSIEKKHPIQFVFYRATVGIELIRLFKKIGLELKNIKRIEVTITIVNEETR
jgi:lysozyme